MDESKVFKARNSQIGDVVELIKCPKFISRRWISVKDRLPEEHKDVLVFWDEFINIGHFEIVFEKIYWISHSSSDLPVSHWMPLPDAPKDES